uniref:TNFR-Cys domain-containing protein n=1 Tax=Monopterus albus TaxID=43700 RepID=A0A3Q3K1S4_MONAL|nr:tumor necrosis factor receptor superfamily member 5-like [Monopterus albus]
MHLLPMMIIMMWALVVMTTAQPQCDPLTQYELHGLCCKKCGPGTSMSLTGTCLEPQCKECRENEYQEDYTTEPVCPRQQYCDPNKNFEVPVHKSKTVRHTCMCKLGFHCSSQACLTCVAHTTCTPGTGAQSIGNHTHDTVCQKCPLGTFSNGTSWNSICQKWTVCEDGHHIQRSGTAVSDNICEKSSRTHIIIMVIVVAILMILLVAVLMYRLHRGGRDLKACVQSCCGEQREMLRDPPVTLIVTPEKDQSLLVEVVALQEEAASSMPEENDDEPTQGFLTENGNFVTQEKGKSVVLSRQESHPQTFID